VRIYGIPAKTATFDTHREAQDWAVIKNGELLAEKKSAEKLLVNSPSDPVSKPIPSNSNPLDGVLVSTILKEYWRTVLPNKVSRLEEKGRIKRLILFFWRKRLQDVSEQHLEYYKSLRFKGQLGYGRGKKGGTAYLLKNKKAKRTTDQNKIGKLPSSQTVRHELALLRRALNHWGRVKKITPQQNNIPVHPIMTINLPEKCESRTRRFSDDELFRVLDAFGNSDTRAAVAFAVCTSLRRSEIVSLQWEDVDLDRRVVRLRKMGYAKKSKIKAREVPLIPSAIKILRDMGQKEYGPIWAMAPSSFTQAFGRAKERAGLKDARLHDLRREAISRYVEKYGLGLEKIMNFSGHREVRTLVEHYLKPQSQNIASEIARTSAGVNFIPL
jgi:integrase